MKYGCIYCGKAILISPEHLGTKLPCPHCGGMVPLPSADHLEPEDEIYDDSATTGGILSSSISGILSLLIHMGLFLLFALIELPPPPKPAGNTIDIGEDTSPKLTDNANETLTQQQAEIKAADSLDQMVQVDAPPPPDASAPGDLEISIAPPAPSGGGSTGAIGVTQIGGGSGGDGGATFMGVRAKGRRFCIIADRSGSMSGRKLEFVKQEVIETVSGMRRGSQFQVIFFNSSATPYPKSNWLHPKKERSELERWLAQSISAGGGTRPYPGFQEAFKLKPRPDAIFFMTDGLFPSNTVQQIAALNTGEKKVVIHTISFMTTSSEQMMREIARQSGGKYRHVAGF